MVSKNESLLETLTQETIQRIYNTWIKYKAIIDVFYVAFSGGKDSIVALDLVQRTLPHDQFVVVFGDTRMEFPDTYNIISEIKEYCNNQSIQFLTSKSEYTPAYTWHEFGPPSQTIRWCCSVHKTSPQILLLRRVTGKPSFRGMAFTGIRADESPTRDQYDYVSFGEKHKGQFSFHPILEWNSAEVFLYIYANKLALNDTYKKGNSRAGCLVCPLATSKNFFFKEVSYGVSDVSEDYTTTMYTRMILETTSKVFNSKKDEIEFLNIGGWKARRSGRELNFAEDYCVEDTDGTVLTITLHRERTNWREWIKTLGNIIDISDDHILIEYRRKKYNIYFYINDSNEQVFAVDVGSHTQDDIYFMSALKIVLRKAAYCIGCHVCEANCPNGYIKMDKGVVSIDDRCTKCQQCHNVPHGCLVADSLRLPKEVSRMGSVDRYSNLGIEKDWVEEYFKKKDDYWDNNGLGTNKIKVLRCFLEDSGITRKHKITDFGNKIAEIGINKAEAWGLIICNLVYTAEFNWWIMHTKTGCTYTRDDILSMLGDDMSANTTGHIVSAFKNIFASNEILGKELGIGDCDWSYDKQRHRVLNSIFRTSWHTPDSRVILYSLYKFAEACGDYYQFRLSTLMDDSIERDGVSPSRIFGLDRETMVQLLNSLSINYPDFIHVAFTLDLDTVSLRPEKSSADVLQLFDEGVEA